MGNLLAILLLITVWASGIALASLPQDSSQTSMIVEGKNQISFDVGIFSPGSDAAGGWRADFALRAGIGKSLTEVFDVIGYLDYYQYRLPLAAGNSAYTPTSVKRHDIAVYADVSMYHFFHVGVGTYYTTSDPVSLVSLSDPTPRPWGDSGFSEFRFFFTAGLEYRIRITDNFFLPVGIYSRSNYAMNNTLPLYLRLGAALTF